MSGAAEKKQERVTLELKICERCGGLWLRPAASRWIYCGGCKKKVAELPKPSVDGGRRRSPKVGKFNAADGTRVGIESPVATERVQ